MSDQLVATFLLAGLPASWSGLVMSIRAPADMKTDIVKGKILQVMRRRKTRENDETPALISKTRKPNPTRNARPHYSKTRSDVKCSNCGKINYYKSECRNRKLFGKMTNKEESELKLTFLPNLKTKKVMQTAKTSESVRKSEYIMHMSLKCH